MPGAAEVASVTADRFAGLFGAVRGQKPEWASSELVMDVPALRAYVESHRIPVSNYFPGTGWVCSLDEESVAPTDTELVQVRAYIEFRCGQFGEPRRDELLAMALPKVPGGYDATVLLKRGEDAWAFRRTTWQSGPTYVPEWDAPVQEPLLAVLDRTQTFGAVEPSADWQAYKASRPGVFAAAA